MKMRTSHPLVPTLLLVFALTLPGISQDSPGPPPPWPILRPASTEAPLPGTSLLESTEGLSHQLVTANDAFLDRRISETPGQRDSLWRQGDFDPGERRDHFAKRLGLHRDARPESPRLEYYSLRKTPRATAEGLTIYHVRWNTIGPLHGDGLILEPAGKDQPIVADVVALPDADQSPEAIAGLLGETGGTTPYALLLAQAGCRVLVPTLVHRNEMEFRMPQREYLHRPAFELGRHLLGYELHKVFSGVDALILSREDDKDRPVGVIGFGEGGLLSLYAGALDPRLQSVAVSGYFGPREALWTEPAEHNIHGLLSLFGDAEIASLISPRSLVIESGVYPDFAFLGNDQGGLQVSEERTPSNGKPGRFFVPEPAEVESELDRLRGLSGTTPHWQSFLTDTAISPATLVAFLDGLGHDVPIEALAEALPFDKVHDTPGDIDLIAERHARQVAEIDRHNQWALIQSRQDRQAYFDKLDTETLETFERTIEPYRETFRSEVIGDFELDRLPFHPRSRPLQEGPETVSYEIVLDVFDEVIAYGILTLPKDLDLESGERRPVVVCQHGLEGAPQDVVGEPKFKAYSAFATRLAERGFITFAPQNGYKFFDRFRLQQFKSQSIGKTLFSIIVPQHLQITDWLASLDFVDPDRIAFYGLSYGGKSAMRIPPLVDRYCLSICSADFNEWVWKNAATDPKSLRYSYANKGEYEIFEWNLGGTFNYAEMAALICPRPFMVERGHFDGVAPDETVAYEFAKVRNLYQARLGIGDRCEIEWFVGPHSINGVGAYAFLEKHLDHSSPVSGPEIADTDRRESHDDRGDGYQSLTEAQRIQFREYLNDLMNTHPDLSREDRDNRIREALRRISAGKNPGD